MMRTMSLVPLIAFALMALNTGAAQGAPLQHASCRVTTKFIYIETNQRGQKTGHQLILSDWYTDIQGKKRPGFFASSTARSQWDAMKEFQKKGYTVLPSTEGSTGFDGLGENDLEFQVNLLCNRDSSYFCIAAINLHKITKGANGDLQREVLAGYSPPRVSEGSSLSAAMYNSVLLSLPWIPSCQKN